MSEATSASLQRRLGVFTATAVMVWPFHALAVLGVLRLRRTRPDLVRPYRTLGYPVVPLIFLGAALWLLTNSLIQQPKVSLLNVAITLAGLPVYFIWRRRAGTT